MTKAEKIKNFDPSQPGLADESIFGLPFSAEESEIVIIPVPWEVTVSYGAGASEGPQAILDASFQVDLHHQEFPELWKLGMHLDLGEHSDNWSQQSEKYKAMAQPIIEALEKLLQQNKSEVFEQNFRPMSLKQFNDEIDASLNDEENDRLIKATDLKNKIQKWS